MTRLFGSDIKIEFLCLRKHLMQKGIVWVIFLSNIAALQLTLDTFNEVGKNLWKSAFVEGDFIIGALFPIHSPPLKNISYLECGPISQSEGIELAEAALFAVDAINKDENILPGIKLGINIKDDCENEKVALYQTIQMLKEPKFNFNATLNSSSYDTSIDKTDEFPLIGMTGTLTKLNMLHYENLLKLFKIPQIGYSTSLSQLISPYFYLSVVPSDYHLVYLLIKVLKKFEWTYITVGYSDGGYFSTLENSAKFVKLFQAYITEYFGLNGKYFLEQMVSNHNICISNSIHITRPKRKMKYVQSTKYLFKDVRSQVIVCFCDEDTLLDIFSEMQKFKLSGKYFILSSNDWPFSPERFKQYEKEANGMLVLAHRNYEVPGFRQYVSNLTSWNNKRNPWYEEYLKTGLPLLDEHNSKIAYVVKSIYTFAHGLHRMYLDVCKMDIRKCFVKNSFNTKVYMKYLTNVSFGFNGEEVEFSFYGSPRIGRFDIYNLQMNNSQTYEFVKIGDYDCHHENMIRDSNNFLHLNIFGEIKYPKNNKPTSVCSKKCPPGHAQVNDKEILCCWQCVSCNETAYLINKFDCKECPENHVSNENKTGCIPAPIMYMKWNNPRCFIAISLSFLIMSLALMIVNIFIRNRHTAIVQSSSAQLNYIILCGVIILSSNNFVLVIKPNTAVCFFAKILPSLALTMIYIPVIFKALQMYYVLKAIKNRNSKFPKMANSFKAQAIIIGIMTISVVIGMILWITIHEKRIYEKTYEKVPHTVEFHKCIFRKKHWLDIFFLAMHFIMIYYGMKIRKLSHNFHEAKFLAIFAFIQAATNMTFRIVYQSTDFQVVSVFWASLLDSFVTLLFLFFPKLYIIIWRSHINTEHNFKPAIELYHSYNQ